MNIQTAKQKERTYCAARLVIIIGFVLAISMGFFDIAISMFSKPSGLSSFSSILPPLAATICFFFVIYLILWFMVISHLGRVFKLEPAPLALSLALFCGVFFILASLGDLIHFTLPLTNLINLFTVLSISLLVSVGIYFITRIIDHKSKYRNIALVFNLAVPFVLAETVVLVWLHIYRIEPFFSIQSFLLNIGYILAVLCTLGLFYRTARSQTIVRLLTVFMILVVLSPVVTLITTQSSESPLKEYTKNTDHRIKYVILITVDTLRADVLSSYDHQQSVSTPHIDQLARDGVLFTKAISPSPWTLPSVASIMTGLSPLVHMTVERLSKLPDSAKTLAEYMVDAGYFTSAIGYNRFLIPDFNLSQGFLEYNFFPKSSIGNSLGVRLLKRLFPKRLSNPDLTQLAIDWLESNYGKDFFLWIHYFDPHIPYSPPPDFLPKGEPPSTIGTSFSEQVGEIRGGYFVPSIAERKWIKDLYDGEVRYVDKNIGKLVDTLKRLNLYDRSLIIFTSDHGEEFWEHDGFEHGHTLYQELLSVPLIMKLPLSASKRQIGTVVSTNSIMPTILDLCGINYESDYLSVDSLSPLLGPSPKVFKMKPIISTGLLYYEDRESVIFDGLKYIRYFITNHEELYDLERDPEERISIAHSSPEKVEKARDILRESKKTAKKLRERHRLRTEKQIRFNEETRQELKSLGYIQ